MWKYANEKHLIVEFHFHTCTLVIFTLTKIYFGGLAQLARASALHAEGQRFESVILHQNQFENMQMSKFENWSQSQVHKILKQKLV